MIKNLKIKKLGIIVPIFLIIVLMITSILVEKSGYKEFLKAIKEAEEVVLVFRDKLIYLRQEQLITFEGEVSNAIFNWSGYPFQEYSIITIIKSKNQGVRYFFISPDRHFARQYWILNEAGQRTQKIKSQWLMFLFNRNGFFDHTKIVD